MAGVRQRARLCRRDQERGQEAKGREPGHPWPFLLASLRDESVCERGEHRARVDPERPSGTLRKFVAFLLSANPSKIVLSAITISSCPTTLPVGTFRYFLPARADT